MLSKYKKKNPPTTGQAGLHYHSCSGYKQDPSHWHQDSTTHVYSLSTTINSTVTNNHSTTLPPSGKNVAQIASFRSQEIHHFSFVQKVIEARLGDRTFLSWPICVFAHGPLGDLWLFSHEFQALGFVKINIVGWVSWISWWFFVGLVGSLPETNSNFAPENGFHWNTIVSFWGVFFGPFSAASCFREGNFHFLQRRDLDFLQQKPCFSGSMYMSVQKNDKALKHPWFDHTYIHTPVPRW